jgi:hypothetical protein
MNPTVVKAELCATNSKTSQAYHIGLHLEDGQFLSLCRVIAFRRVSLDPNAPLGHKHSCYECRRVRSLAPDYLQFTPEAKQQFDNLVLA